MTTRSVGIIGAGLSGATCAYVLNQAGWDVRVYESRSVWGGQLATEQIGGVLYEPHGAHIFHTKDREVWELVTGLAAFLPFRHHVKTEVNGRTLSWPPQVDELRALPEWPVIARELAARPESPSSENFETWCIDVAGSTLYEWFISPYTQKQWGCDPRLLSAAWAPKRIELRDDGYRPLFRDPYQGWPAGGYRPLMDALLSRVPVELGVTVSVDQLDVLLARHTAVVVTAPLDAFFHEALGRLAWRGVTFVHDFIPDVERVLAAPVVNHPGLDEPYTRRIETKWMSGQEIEGTVVSREFPGGDARHYPVDDVGGENRQLAQAYRRRLSEVSNGRAIAVGRLATYTYIDMDQAIRQALNACSSLLRA